MNKTIITIFSTCMLAGCISTPPKPQQTAQQIMRQITPYTAVNERKAFADTTVACSLAQDAHAVALSRAAAADIRCKQARLQFHMMHQSRVNAAKAAEKILEAQERPIPTVISCISSGAGRTTYTTCH